MYTKILFLKCIIIRNVSWSVSLSFNHCLYTMPFIKLILLTIFFSLCNDPDTLYFLYPIFPRPFSLYSLVCLNQVEGPLCLSAVQGPQGLMGTSWDWTLFLSSAQVRNKLNRTTNLTNVTEQMMDSCELGKVLSSSEQWSYINVS